MMGNTVCPANDGLGTDIDTEFQFYKMDHHKPHSDQLEQEKSDPVIYFFIFCNAGKKNDDQPAG